jgi:hypothetical protein
MIDIPELHAETLKLSYVELAQVIFLLTKSLPKNELSKKKLNHMIEYLQLAIERDFK